MDDSTLQSDDSELTGKQEIKKIFTDPSLRASVKECAYASIMVGSGENSLNAFAVFLKASTFQIGLLFPLSILLAAISQLMGVELTEVSSSRRRIIVQCVFVQAILWLPIALLYFVFGASELTTWLLIIFAGLYFASGNLGTPAWSSLIGDLVPSEVRGRFFGYRNEKFAVIMLLSVLGSGALLQYSQKLGMAGLGFSLIFLIAGISRMVSCYYLTLHRDPPYQSTPQSRFTYIQFLKRSPTSNFAKFVFFTAFMSFSVWLSAPFFNPYMLDVLKLPYFTYNALTATVLMMMFFTARYWGRLTDKYGNKSVLILCSFGVFLNPLMWLLWSSLPGLFFIQAFSGVVWGGYNLAITNFLFDAVTPQKRARCVAYQAITCAVFGLLGAMCGSLLATHLPIWVPLDKGVWTPQSAFLRVFFISGILRGLACIYMLPKFQEVRNVRSISQKELIYQFLQILPLVGGTLDLFLGRRRGR